jgi:hypothetical protein
MAPATISYICGSKKGGAEKVCLTAVLTRASRDRQLGKKRVPFARTVATRTTAMRFRYFVAFFVSLRFRSFLRFWCFFAISLFFAFFGCFF